jgi:hypothetical protein
MPILGVFCGNVQWDFLLGLRLTIVQDFLSTIINDFKPPFSARFVQWNFLHFVLLEKGALIFIDEILYHLNGKRKHDGGHLPS